MKQLTLSIEHFSASHPRLSLAIIGAIVIILAIIAGKAIHAFLWACFYAGIPM
ncbi:MAG: hypothetical protein NC187_00515 [Candidatus Amulumruptor caecigallinarius]|nr:hypothetical protein [Candidatus Amulumruptor caecigallinarius]MCM1395959.1 hypothetical protein [Candidatus Amulumruptor caecigallinarius]MCM1452994.1 hypothetical protein [bacterium]